VICLFDKPSVLVGLHLSRFTLHVSFFSASDEMHDFYFVTFRNRCRGPIGTPNYPFIQFHGNALSIQPEHLYQIADTRAFDHFGLIPINDEGQLSPSGDFPTLFE
jgi:hypothetical protein